MSSELVEFFSQFGSWNWLIISGLLFIFEFILPGFYLLFFGLAALITGLIAQVVDLTWQAQAALFTALSILNIYLARFFWNPNAKSDEPLLNKRGAQHIGRIYTLVTPISNGRGKAQVGDTHWLVRGPDLPEGKQVKVVDVDGATLIVEES